MINFQLKKLSNGLRVITAPMGNTQAVTLLILVGVGSRFESDSQAGISHFLEHMFFKGTKKRPTYKEISQELDYLGGDFNAFTAEEYTGYFVQAAADKFPKALDILADMFFNSTFPPAEVEREKGVIIEEINMYEDQPMSKVAEAAQQLVLGKTPLGRPIIGSKKTVGIIDQNNLKSYRNLMYQPTSTIVVVAGAELNYNWQKEINNLFGRWENKTAPQYANWKADAISAPMEFIQRATDQAHLVMAFPTFAITDKRRSQLRLLTNLLGGMMSARLFEEVREKRGLAYYINAGTSDHHDIGYMYIRAGVMLDKIGEALTTIRAVLANLSMQHPPAEELKRAKENMKGQIYLGLEDSQSVAQYLANRLLYYGTILQPEKMVAEIEAVTPVQISALAKTVFSQANEKLAVLGPERIKKLVV